MADGRSQAGDTTTSPEDRTIISTSGHSFDPNDPTFTCAICQVAYFSGEGDTWEPSVVLACGHHLGQSCAERWLRTNPTCPFCRRSMRFGCGHTIAPIEAFLLPGRDLDPRPKCSDCLFGEIDEFIAQKAAPFQRQAAENTGAIGRIKAELASSTLSGLELDKMKVELRETEHRLHLAWFRLEGCWRLKVRMENELQEDLDDSWHMALDSA